jgi:hypothetical protein
MNACDMAAGTVEVGFVDGDDAGELKEEPRGFARVGCGAVRGAGCLAILGFALGAAGVVIADDGGDGLNGVADVECGDVSSVGVRRGLAEGEHFTRLGKVQPREHAGEGQAVFLGDDRE